ncbi:FRG domain-containing protein [Nocardiopsis composta]|uniref:FRG domain-containing protein n=1 Tax=Nocardiopsis composta TaxID=157465 RepID=UPI002483A4AE|nr:FRG domain-containing protein [Nocardiopsis composta]
MSKLARGTKRVRGADFFGPWEGDPVTSWESALSEIESVLKRTGQRRAVGWRGQVDARWSLHSGLYRRLLDARSAVQPAPKEDDLLRAEEKIAHFVRGEWRFDQMPYLELLANLQHFRGPTRMLDVSLSPLVALWFAVEEQHGELDSADGRIFAFDVTNRRVQLNEKWNTYDIPWRESGRNTRWCRDLPLLWRPPSYNERIPAQQSGFLLAGVPKVYGGGNAQYRKAPGTSGELWRIDEVRRATSLPTKMVDRSGKALQQGTEPTLTIRIAAEAKAGIRRRLERDYGYNPATMYPDLFGMAAEVRRAVDSAALLK